jgi:hypothetical protein
VWNNVITNCAEYGIHRWTGATPWTEYFTFNNAFYNNTSGNTNVFHPFLNDNGNISLTGEPYVNRTPTGFDLRIDTGAAGAALTGSAYPQILPDGT